MSDMQTPWDGRTLGLLPWARPWGVSSCHPGAIACPGVVLRPHARARQSSPPAWECTPGNCPGIAAYGHRLPDSQAAITAFRPLIAISVPGEEGRIPSQDTVPPDRVTIRAAPDGTERNGERIRARSRAACKTLSY